MGSNSNYTECAPGSFLERPEVRWPLVMLYAAVLACCFFGNLFLLCILIGRRSMRTATNFFLANLAVADILVALFCIVQNLGHTLLFKHSSWPLGAMLCYVYIYVLRLVPSISAGLLVLVSAEKYVALAYPLLSRRILTNELRIALTVFVWLVALIANYPFYWASNYFEMAQVNICTGHHPNAEEFVKYFLRISFVIWYCVPVLIMGFLYTRIAVLLWASTSGVLADSNSAAIAMSPRSSTMSRPMTVASPANGPTTEVVSPMAQNNRTSSSRAVEKMQSFESSGRQSSTDIAESRRKVVRLLACVVLSFACLTLPHHLRLLFPRSHHCNNSPTTLMRPITYLLLFANSGINPFLYAFMSQRFRTAAADLLCCAVCTGEAHGATATGGPGGAASSVNGVNASLKRPLLMKRSSEKVVARVVPRDRTNSSARCTIDGL